MRGAVQPDEMPGDARLRAARRSPSRTSAGWRIAQGGDPAQADLPDAAARAVRRLRQERRAAGFCSTGRPVAARRTWRARRPVRSTPRSWRSGCTTCWTCGSASPRNGCTGCLRGGSQPQSPCVLFFDEVDALGAKPLGPAPARADATSSTSSCPSSTASTTTNEGILTLAATNAPWHLDSRVPPARPVRRGRVRAPARPLRARRDPGPALERQADGKTRPRCRRPRRPPEFSGADLRAVVDNAIDAKPGRGAARPARPLADHDARPARPQPSAAEPTTTDWFATARNHALYANERRLVRRRPDQYLGR